MSGWLSYYQNGYMHRDVSIGNVLKLKTTVKRKPFSTKSVQSLLESPATESDQSKAAGSTPSNPKVASDVFSDSAEALHEDMAQLDIEGDASVAPDSFWHNLLNEFDSDVQRRPIVKYAKRLEEIVGELGIETDCVAVLSDCDMVAEMTGYFALNNRQGSISVRSLSQLSSHVITDLKYRGHPSLCPAISEMPLMIAKLICNLQLMICIPSFGQQSGRFCSISTIREQQPRR